MQNSAFSRGGAGRVDGRGCGLRRSSGAGGGNLPRLAVEFGFDGYGDLSDGSHGRVLQRGTRISLYLECAPEVDNYLQNGFRGGQKIDWEQRSEDRKQRFRKDGWLRFIVSPVSKSRPGAPIVRGELSLFPQDRGHPPGRDHIQGSWSNGR